jgi:ubiquinone biosynthesis protein COQ4
MNPARIAEYFTGIKGFVSLVRDPNNTDSVFEIVEGFSKTEPYRHMVSHLRSIPECAALIAERYDPPVGKIAELRLLPEGTLGKVFATEMERMGLDPEFFPKLEVEDDLSYVALRLRKTHDIWHQVAGFGTDVPGEVGLQAFGLAQLHNPLSIAILAGTLLRALRIPGALESDMDELTRGWALGRSTRPFFAQRWEEHWDKPLAVWRAELGVPMAS